MAVHGMKYPKHNRAEKGSEFAGECNRTACSEGWARFFNIWTYGYYCAPCARAINFKERICIEVHHDLTTDEMDELFRKEAA